MNCARSEAVSKRPAAAKDTKKNVYSRVYHKWYSHALQGGKHHDAAREEARAAACMAISSFGGDAEPKKLRVAIQPAEELKETRAKQCMVCIHTHPQIQGLAPIHPQDIFIPQESKKKITKIIG